VHFYEDEQALGRAATQIDDAIVVWQLAFGAEGDIESLATAMRGHQDAQSVLLYMDLTRAAARQVVAVAEHLPQARIALGGHDDLQRTIVALRKDAAEPTAVSKIVLRLLPLVPERAKDAVATAVVVGRRRTPVQAFASLCGAPVRTLEWHLSSSHVASAEDLLGRMVALHSLWRLDVLAWSPKRAATGAGFESRNAWSNYVARHAGAHPPTLLREIGFAGLLGRCVGEIVPDQPALRF
jgi:hypothetical protein